MAIVPIERWRSWRAEQREERLERLARQLQAGGRGPVAGGFALKLFALAFVIALVVGIFMFIGWLFADYAD